MGRSCRGQCDKFKPDPLPAGTYKYLNGTQKYCRVCDEPIKWDGGMRVMWNSTKRKGEYISVPDNKCPCCKSTLALDTHKKSKLAKELMVRN